MKVMLSKVTVGVMGSGSKQHDKLAIDVGALLAELGVNLLTGGGQGVMKSVSKAFTQAQRRSGVCIGIIPCESLSERGKPKHGYPNEFVELAIYTHLPFSGDKGKDDLSRNHINVLSCAAIIALPGDKGTDAEVSLALTYKKPIIAYSPDESLAVRFDESVRRVTKISEVRDFLNQHLKLSEPQSKPHNSPPSSLPAS